MGDGMANISFKLTANDKTKEPIMQAILDKVTQKPQVQAHMNRISKKLSMQWIYGTKIRFDGQVFYPATFTTLTKRAKDE